MTNEKRKTWIEEAYLIRVECGNCGHVYETVSNILYWVCPKCKYVSDNTL